MFKKAKGGSTFKSGSLSAGTSEKKSILEELGYVFDSVIKKSGWHWSSSRAQSQQNQPSESKAIEDAGCDAGQHTQEAMNTP